MKKVPSLREVISAHLEIGQQQILDIGCGKGGLVRWLTKQRGQVVGLEVQTGPLKHACDRKPVAQEQYLQGTGAGLPFRDGSFDHVFFSYSLHHIPQPEVNAALSAAQRVLKPGANLVVIEPLADGPGFEVQRLVDDETEVLAYAYKSLQEKFGTPLTEYFFAIDYFYRDPETMCQDLVTVDPARQPTIEAHRKQLETLFYQYGRESERGYAFEGRIRLNILPKFIS